MFNVLSGLFCALLHCRCIVWKVFKVFFDKTKESGYRSMKTEVFFLFVCFYARRDKLKIKKPSQNLDLYYLLLCHQKRGRMLGFLSLICSFNICISYVIDNVFRCVLTVESYTHLLRHSPHRSYSPSCFVWTEWPLHHFGCPTETVRNEGENKSTGTNYFTGDHEKANNYSWTQIIDNKQREREKVFQSLGKRHRQRKYEYEN